jgi:PAS domain S-box-containing protein
LNIAQRLPGLRGRRHSARVYLTALVVLILVPALAFGWWLVVRAAGSERSVVERNAQREAREITVTMDREITNAKNVLTALAGSHLLLIGDLEGFYRQASDVAQQLDIQIALRDPRVDGQLLNTARSFGAPLAQGVPPALAQAERRSLDTGRAIVSDVYFAAVVNQHVVAVVLPVRHGSADTYILSIGIPTRRLAEILYLTQYPPRWVIGIYDRNRIIIARSERHEEFTGTKIASTESSPELSGSEAVYEGRSRDGTVIRWFRHQSSTTGWMIAVGVPVEVLNAPAYASFIQYGAASGLLMLIAVALSYYAGGRISQSIGTLGIDRAPTREEFRILFESAPNGVLVVDSNGIMVIANERMERKFGYDRDELVGRPVEMLIPERYRGGHLRLRQAYAAAPRARQMGEGRELYGQRKDGSEFPIEIGLSPIATSNAQFAMATVVDITRRKLAEQKLTAALGERDDLRRRFMQAQEDERLRLAHELHDQTGQSLAAVMLELKGVEALVTDSGRDQLRQLRGQLEEMGKTLHRVAWELRPTSIDELGLTSALANHVSEWSAKIGIDGDFHCGDRNLDRLPDEIRTSVYRVVQEALTNIAKHAAGTTSVSVVIDRSGGTLRLTIEDNGCGFESAQGGGNGAGRGNGGLGIAGMRERLALIGGELEIETSPHSGTTIFARIPLDRDRLNA